MAAWAIKQRTARCIGRNATALLFALFATAPSMTQAAVETAMRYLPAVSNFWGGGISFDSSLQDLQGGTARVCSKFADMWNAHAHSPNAGTYAYSAWVWDGAGTPSSSYGSGGTPGPDIAGYVYSGRGRGVQCTGTFYSQTRGFYCAGTCTGTRYAGEPYACGMAVPSDWWCIDVMPPRYNDSRGAGSLYAYCPLGYQARLHNTDPSQDRCEAMCVAPEVFDAKTGECVQTCQPPDVIDPATGQCVHCPIDPLPDLPKDDACTRSLEAGRGKDVNNACPAMTKEMQDQAQCLADKIHKLGIPYTEPSATIRTEAYQNHLLAVWNKLQEIEDTALSDAEKRACATTLADVDIHRRHGIKSDPSNKGNNAPHVLGRAVDISLDVVEALQARVTNTTFITLSNCLFCIPIAVTTIGDVQDYVNNATVNPPPCNLTWGGRFKNRRPDPVHFQLP